MVFEKGSIILVISMDLLDLLEEVNLAVFMVVSRPLGGFFCPRSLFRSRGLFVIFGVLVRGLGDARFILLGPGLGRPVSSSRS